MDAFYDAVRVSHPELHRTASWARPDYGRADAATYVARQWLAWNDGTAYAFAITRPDVPGLLGIANLDDISTFWNEANLGYWIRTDVVGQGLATLSARLVARFGFEHVKLRRLRLLHAAGNRASQRVAEKLGFVREGQLRDHLELRGSLSDTVLYSLVGLHELR